MHSQVTVVEARFGTPLGAAIRTLWAEQELGNDFCYYPWDEDLASEYPTIDEYIKANQLEGKVLLHYSW